MRQKHESSLAREGTAHALRNESVARCLAFALTGALCIGFAACSPPEQKEAEAKLSAKGLPKRFTKYAWALEQQKLPQIVITPTKDIVASPTASKFRGAPYWPKSMEYPADVDGVPMLLLVQLNFAEMPPLPGYPTDGILQFFISPSESDAHRFGMWDDAANAPTPAKHFAALQEPRYFRVVYHAVVDDDASQLLNEFPTPEAAELPMYDEAALGFTLRDSYMKMGDYRFARVFGKDFDDFYEQDLDEDFDKVEEYWEFEGPRTLAVVGGYSTTEQGYDPRIEAATQDWLVLLSIDTSADTNLNMMWGDGGVANWWIQREALAARDFSRVAYYWDEG
jgi:uncharacterized protein YwqG